MQEYYYCITKMGKRVTRSYKIDEEVANELDRVADETGEYKSRIIENALQEYFDRDRFARVEGKLDEVLDRLGDLEGTSAETQVKKENSDVPIQQRRTNEIVDHVLDQVGTDEMFPQSVVREAIVRLRGDSEYNLETYIPRVKETLEAEGWHYISTTQVWVADEERYLDGLESSFELALDTVNDPNEGVTGGSTKLEALQKALETLKRGREDLTDHGVTSSDQLQQIQKVGQRKLSRLE